MTGPQDLEYRSRRLKHLQDLGVVTTKQAGLAARAAALVSKKDLNPNALAVSVKTLRQLDIPDVAASLFPEELSMRPRLWKHLEWEQLPEAPPAPDVPEFAALDMSSTGLDITATPSANIINLPPKQRTLARRVLRSCGVEGQEITVANVHQAGGHKGLTTSELEVLADIRRAIVDRTDFGAPAMTAILDVPCPGEQRIPLVHAGSTPVTLVVNIRIFEEVTDTDGYLEREYAMTRKTGVEVKVAEGEQVLLLDHDRSRVRSDILLDSGSHPVALRPGATYRVERWKDGERIESSDVALPAFKPQEQQDLRPYAGYQPRHNGDPLPRVLTKFVDLIEMHRRGQTQTKATFEYAFGAKAVKGQDGYQFDRQPRLEVTPGRYKVGNDLTIDVFAGGAARAQFGDLGFEPMQDTDDDFEAHFPASEVGGEDFVVRMSNSGTIDAPGVAYYTRLSEEYRTY